MPKTLTARTVQTLKAGKSDRFISDESTDHLGRLRRGLYLRVSKTGRKSWYIRHGTKRRVLGHFPAMGLAEAREAFDDARERIAAGKPAVPEESRESYTVERLCRDYVVRHLKAHGKRSAPEAERTLWRDVVPRFGERLASELRSADVTKMHDEIVDRGAPRAAQAVVGWLKSAYAFAMERGLADANPVRLRVRRARPNRKALEAGELRNLLLNRDALPVPLRDIVLLQALTFARISEVTGLIWAELDLGAGIWTLPAERAKNGCEHRVMLSRQALALLERQKGAHPRLVFPSPKSRGVMLQNTAATAIARRRHLLGVPEDFSTHILRHTGATWLAKSGSGKEIRDRCLNHKDNGIDAVYLVGLNLDEEARAWGQRWADYLDSLQADNVLPMVSRKA